MLDDKIKKTSEYVNENNQKLSSWKVEPSTSAKNCRNFIREVVDNLNLEPNPNKRVIALSIGDPTVYGNLPPPVEAIQAVSAVLNDGTFNGYVPSAGIDGAREAIAEYLTNDRVEVKSDDIIICSGCSSALEHCITVLADPTKRQNILIPRPGFPLYRTLAESIGVEVRYYNLLPESNWQADLSQLESQIDKNTASIIINNPSNPCGSVYSEEHLRDLLEIAYKYKLPVIADEIYERLVFRGEKFISMASLNTGVPILACGGLAKRFLVPGWRVGWISIHDDTGAFERIRRALICLTQRTIGCTTLIQGALPEILKNTPQSFHDNLIDILQRNAQIAYEGIMQAKGLTPFMPQGAMYMVAEIQMEKFPMFENGLDFARKMMEEESVFCLPGECFFFPGFMRIVITVPEELLMQACLRIQEFCNRHYTEKIST